MPVLGNSRGRLPCGPEEISAPALHAALRFCLSSFSDDKSGDPRRLRHLQHQPAGLQLLLAHRHPAGADQQYTNSYNPATHAIGFQWPQIYGGAGNGGCSNMLWAGLLRHRQQHELEGSLHRAVVSVASITISAPGMRCALSYIGSATHQLVWAPDENTLPFSNTVSAYDQPLSARLFPNWGRINTRATGANSSYHSFQADASHRLQSGMEFHSTFTYANAMADNQGPANIGFGGESGGNRATSILDRHADYGHVYGTRRLRWNTTGLFDLPFGRGKLFGGDMSRWPMPAVGGWRLATIFLSDRSVQSPYFPSGQGDPSGTGSGLNGAAAGLTAATATSIRIASSASASKPAGAAALNWINAAAFACPGYPGGRPEPLAPPAPALTPHQANRSARYPTLSAASAMPGRFRGRPRHHQPLQRS